MAASLISANLASAPADAGFRRILVPTDFSDISQKALSFAKSIAKLSDAKILLAHVSEAFNPITPPEVIWFERFTTLLPEEQQLEEQRHALKLQGFRAGTIRLSGEIQHELLASAEREQADLIVLGTHARGGISRLVLGSEAETLFRHAKCPVLVVSPSAWPVTISAGPRTDLPAETPPWRPKDVIFASDLDPASAPNVAYACRLAQAYGAAIRILHVETGEGSASAELAVLRFEQAITALLAPDEIPNIHLLTLREGQDVASVLASLAIQRDSDLIVVGAHATPSSQSHLARGIVPRVLAEAPCPVLVLHQQ